ncbi:hypothetical protein Rhow_006236 [Rhodococcus wratislaviensis]|uniref:Uncharacterized protein n=1 Tax=Rhodococcus wratislaviensis TaxID=44752 RepID=A0A402CFG3_RHOWR|nr:hypothetical protein Rhow_006236 [Rhodococcus wratislaviensis]
MGLCQALPTQCAPPGSRAGRVPAVGDVVRLIQPCDPALDRLSVRRLSHPGVRSAPVSTY